MFSSIKLSLSRFATLNGRATRKEFWLFVLFYYSMSLLGSLFDVVFSVSFGSLLTIVLIVPYISCAARRMHDVGKSGWFMIVPFYNLILALSPTVPEKTE